MEKKLSLVGHIKREDPILCWIREGRVLNIAKSERVTLSSTVLEVFGPLDSDRPLDSDDSIDLDIACESRTKFINRAYTRLVETLNDYFKDEKIGFHAVFERGSVVLYDSKTYQTGKPGEYPGHLLLKSTYVKDASIRDLETNIATAVTTAPMVKNIATAVTAPKKSTVTTAPTVKSIATAVAAAPTVKSIATAVVAPKRSIATATPAEEYIATEAKNSKLFEYARTPYPKVRVFFDGPSGGGFENLPYADGFIVKRGGKLDICYDNRSIDDSTVKRGTRVGILPEKGGGFKIITAK